jgi:hypothetical protein
MPNWAAAAAKLFASTTRTNAEIAEKSSIARSKTRSIDDYALIRDS